MAIWYCSSVGWTAVTAWAALTSYSIGDIRRQLAAPTVGNERVWRCTTAGTSGAAEPTWTLTKGSTTNDGTAVWTEITGNSTYNATNTFAAPHARLRKAFDWSAAGDDIYIADNSAATEAATITYNTPGTAASPVRVLSVDHTNATPTLLAGATETATGDSSIVWSNTVSGEEYIYGITFSAARTGGFNFQWGGSNDEGWTYEDCKFRCTGAGSGMNGMPFRSKSIRFLNTSVRFAGTGATIAFGARFEWKGPAGIESGGTVPSVLFTPTNNASLAGVYRITGVDLSEAGSGKTLFDVGQGANLDAILTDCKLGASVAITTGTIRVSGATRVTLVNCDSADTNYRFFEQTFGGTTTHEIVIVRTGGASDGTTPFSRKMVSTANVKFFAPMEGPWFYFWNETLSAITVGIEIVTDNVTLTDAEAWIEVEVLANGSFPIGSFLTDRMATILGTPANQTTSSETWTTTGLGTPVKQVLSKAVTPAEKGWVRARVCLAKASTTLYACPKLGVT